MQRLWNFDGIFVILCKILWNTGICRWCENDLTFINKQVCGSLPNVIRVVISNALGYNLAQRPCNQMLKYRERCYRRPRQSCEFNRYIHYGCRQRRNFIHHFVFWSSDQRRIYSIDDHLWRYLVTESQLLDELMAQAYILMQWCKIKHTHEK